MQDIGKSIYEASSPRALLTGLLGGIKGGYHAMHSWAMANLLGHESLLDAKILHRDISIGNVMLTMAEQYWHDRDRMTGSYDR